MYEGPTRRLNMMPSQLSACRAFALRPPKEVRWTPATALREGYARLQGYYDYRRKRDHHIWEMVGSTKDLEAGTYQGRRKCNAQSVIVFRLMLEGARANDCNPEREDRAPTEAARKLLPVPRSTLH